MEEKAYLRMETPGATGMEGVFLRLLGALKRIPTGKKTPPEKEEEMEEKLTSEEKIKRGRETLRKHQEKYGKGS